MKRLITAALKALTKRLFALALVPVFTLASAASSHGLDFRCPVDEGVCTGSSVWASGSVSTGDYDRVESLLKQRGPQTAIFVLTNSSGGDVHEAIKIGLLLHRLKVATALGWLDEENGRLHYAYYPEASSSALGDFPRVRARNAICADACSYIWLGGRVRYGYAYLGSPIFLSTLTDVARQADPQAPSPEERDYLKQLSLPSSFPELPMDLDGRHFLMVKPAYVLHQLARYSSKEISDRVDGCAMPSLEGMIRVSVDSAALLQQYASCLANATRAARDLAWATEFDPTSN